MRLPLDGTAGLLGNAPGLWKPALAGKLEDLYFLYVFSLYFKVVIIECNRGQYNRIYSWPNGHFPLQGKLGIFRLSTMRI
jgi:hypothetical protein